jgi:hypothetical protein
MSETELCNVLVNGSKRRYTELMCEYLDPTGVWALALPVEDGLACVRIK